MKLKKLKIIVILGFLLLGKVLASTTKNVENNDNFSKIIGMKESSNNYKAVNRLGYLGKYQFGGMALKDLGYKDIKTGKWTGKDGISNKNDFLESPKIQEKAFSQWRKLLDRYLKNYNVYKHINSKFKGITVTKHGLMAAAHLVGALGVSKMLKYNKVPEDANGTKATDYMKLFEKEE